MQQTVVFILAAIIVGCLYMLARNSWVYRVRTRILDESEWVGGDFAPYNTLPSYDQMMAEFWNWNASSFVGRKGA